MFRRISCAAVVALSLAAHATRAQFPRRGGYDQQPGYWVGLWLGYLDGMTINDGATGNLWQFGYAPQIGATLEKAMQSGVSVGVSAAFATMPLTYQSNSFNSFNACGGSCQANADVSQYLAFIRGGGGVGFHGLYTLEAGVTQFSNFREQGTDLTLDPVNSVYDFTFGLGGGLGFGFTPTMDAYVGYQLDVILHSQANAAALTAVPRQSTLRAGFRVGF